jgi:hypothetical protein
VRVVSFIEVLKSSCAPTKFSIYRKPDTFPPNLISGNLYCLRRTIREIANSKGVCVHCNQGLQARTAVDIELPSAHSTRKLTGTNYSGSSGQTKDGSRTSYSSLCRRKYWRCKRRNSIFVKIIPQKLPGGKADSTSSVTKSGNGGRF